MCLSSSIWALTESAPDSQTKLNPTVRILSLTPRLGCEQAANQFLLTFVCLLVDFPSIYSRYKLEKSAIDDDEDVIMRTYCGNDVVLLPPAAKKNSPFDSNVPYHMDGVEYILDHTMQRMLTKNKPGAESADSEDDEAEEDLNSDDEFMPSAKKPKSAYVGNSASHAAQNYYDGGISHPLLLTEAPLMPRYTRGYLMQLAYEAYGTSSLCFGIDSLFSLLYDHNNNYVGCTATDSFGASADPNSYFDSAVPTSGLESRSIVPTSPDAILYPSEALVIGSGFESTHIMPVYNSRIENSLIARLGVGGHHVTDSLNRSVQLLYPQHKPSWSKLLPSASMAGPGYAAAEAVKEQDCIIASPDFTSMLREVQHGTIDSSFYRNYQFSYEPRPIVVISEEERKQREVRRTENAERLREMSRRKKEEKLIQKSNRMDELEALFVARNSAQLSSTEIRSLIRRAGFDEPGDEDTAATGNPHDRVVQELAEVRKYLDRFADDTIQAERQSTTQPPAPGSVPTGPPPTPWSEMTLEAKLATMDTRLPLTVISEDDLDETEKELKRAQLKVKQMTLTKIRRGHERAMARAANSGAPVGASSAAAKAKATVTIDIDDEGEDGENGEAGEKRQTQIEITIDMTKDLMLLGLDELQLQRKALWARAQKLQASLDENNDLLKDASEAVNKAKVDDIANFASVLQGGGAAALGGPASSSSMNGVGSIAGAIGARSSRAKKADMMLFNAATAAQDMNMDPEAMERLSILRLDHPDMMSVKASQRESELKAAVERYQTSLVGDRELLAKLDDEILSRLSPEVLRQREAESYQLTLGVNRIRPTEILFQPSIIGLDQMGLSESVHAILARATEFEGNVKRTQPSSSSAQSELKSQLMRRVYLAGGNAGFKHMTSRVHASAASDLPVGTTVRVIQASSPVHAAWQGAALFSNSPINQKRHFVPISAYLEEGAERIHEKFLGHFAANRS